MAATGLGRRLWRQLAAPAGTAWRASHQAGAVSRWGAAAIAAGAVGGYIWADNTVSAATPAATAAPAAAAAASPADAKQQVSWSERVVGNYENRVRWYSAPEKVFEYFASVVDDDGEAYMTPEDFMRSITPYNPFTGGEVGSPNPKFDSNRSRSQTAPDVRARYAELLASVVADKQVSAEELAKVQQARVEWRIDNTTHVKCLQELGLSWGEFESMIDSKIGRPKSPFMDLIDSDGDGLLSYSEYVFFVTLLSVPDRLFEVAFRFFDANSDGGIDSAEFVELMARMRERSAHGKHVRDKTLLKSKGRIAETGQLAMFFGPAGDKRLAFDSFKAYMEKLRHAIMRHDFDVWDSDHSGALSPFEFGVYLVTFAPSSQLEKYMERAEKLRTMEGKITFEQYVAFNRLLHRLDELKVAVRIMRQSHASSGLKPDQFQHATAACMGVSSRNAKLGLSALQVEILFALFDDNGDGRLNDGEFIDLMKARVDRSLNRSRDLAVVDTLQRLAKCTAIQIKGHE